jgi:hypothetical protein
MQLTNKMPVDLSQFNGATALFQQHYFLEDCNTGFGGQDIVIPLQSLRNAIDGYMKATSAGPNDVALQMVHCYDPTSNELYLRIQLCSLQTTSPGNYSLNSQNGAWYEVRNGSMNSTTDTSPSDDNYFNYFYYCEDTPCDNSTQVNLATGTDRFVRNQVLPWGLEILQMINANQSGASISFAASSFTGNPTAAVTYPHCLVLSLLDGNGNRLIDNNVYTGTFTMKAADYSTLCPNCCNCYKTPA